MSVSNKGNTFEFRVDHTNRFFVVYFDHNENREIYRLDPVKFFEFRTVLDRGYSTHVDKKYIAGKSDRDQFSLLAARQHDPHFDKLPVFDRLVAASIEWVTNNTNLNVEYESGYAVFFDKRKFFGIDPSLQNIVYVDLTKIAGAKDGELRFENGTTLTPSRKFYELIQEKIFLSDLELTVF